MDANEHAFLEATLNSVTAAHSTLRRLALKHGATEDNVDLAFGSMVYDLARIMNGVEQMLASDEIEP